jgi:glutaredoxin 2
MPGKKIAPIFEYKQKNVIMPESLDIIKLGTAIAFITAITTTTLTTTTTTTTTATIIIIIIIS